MSTIDGSKMKTGNDEMKSLSIEFAKYFKLQNP